MFLVLFLTGLAGSVGHCLGMCGPLVILAGARYPRKGLAAAPLHLLYHTGRILVYGLLGAVVGALGGTVEKIAVETQIIPTDSITATARISGALSLLIGLAVILAGLSYLGWLPFWRRALHTGGWWQRVMKKVMRAPGTSGVLLLGMLNGLLPCGLVYEALLIAGSSGSPITAGLGMLAFGSATILTLLLFGLGVQMLSVRVRQAFIWVGGVFVVLVGISLVLRGAAGLGFFPALLNQGVSLC